MGAKPRLVSTLVVLSSVVLAALGNLFGNLVTDTLVGILPSGWRASAPLLLGPVTLAAVVVGAGFSWLQRGMGERDPRRRSQTLQRVAAMLIVVGAVLAAIGGVLSDAAAGSLPAGLKPYALPLFVAVIGGAIAVGVLVYGREHAPGVVANTNRTNFLTKLQTRYTRRQEDALRGALLIALGLQEEPAEVSRPALTVGALADGQTLADTRALPTGTGITQAYEEAGGQVLILGSPGAGKTTLLVELGLRLVERARADSKLSLPLPLPVIFNLSTWAINRRPLDTWLAEDLAETYQVPRVVAQGWVAGEEILPLLDGLDEVDVHHRAACVQAINAFHQAHEQQPLVVCSRVEEYRVQGERLALRRAVVVQSLTDDKIKEYLASGGANLAVLRAAVETDNALREVLRTPLMLRVVVLTYEGLPLEAIPPIGEQDAWVRQVFGGYVERMLKRRRLLEVGAAEAPEEAAQPMYPPEVAQQYLVWLGGQMRAHGLVELYLERLQLDWLPDARARRRYRRASRLVVGLASGLSGGLVVGLVGGLGAGLVGGLAFGLVGVLFFGLSAWVAFGLGDPKEITPTAAFQWSWRRGLLGGLVFGLVGGLVLGLIAGLLAGLDFGLVGALVGALNGGLNSKQVKEQDYRTPNEGILNSARIGVGAVLLSGLSGGLFGGMLTGLVLGLSGKLLLLVRLSYGLGVGLFFGLSVGLSAALNHATLRWVMRRAGLVPPHLVRFLNYAADHVLLQRVGGGYRFVHILLRDYFADLSQQPGGRDKA